DELGRISPTVQARLLRVLEERVVRPLGGDTERAVDVRVIAASRDDVDAEVAAGRFRPDLLYRLAVVRVALPPLRTRREDLAILVRELLRRRGFADEPPAGPNLDRLIAHAPGAQRFADLAIRIDPAQHDAGAGDGLPVRSDLPYADAKALVLHEL